MSMPRMVDLFMVKESVDSQHWTSNGKRYNVGKLYEWVEKECVEPVAVPLGLLVRGFEKTNTDEEKDSEEFWDRADRAGDQPVLIVKDLKERLWIADGNHRFARKQRDGYDTIIGYIVEEKNLPKYAIEPKK